MAIKRYKPTSSARRFMSVSAFEEITCLRTRDTQVVEMLTVELP